MPNLDPTALRSLARAALDSAEKAYSGPWESMSSCPHRPTHDCGAMEVFATQPELNCIRASICVSSVGQDGRDNLAFIAAARESVPALARGVLQLIEENERLLAGLLDVSALGCDYAESGKCDGVSSKGIACGPCIAQFQIEQHEHRVRARPGEEREGE